MEDAQRPSVLPDVLERHRDAMIEAWVETNVPIVGRRAPSAGRAVLADEARELIDTLREGVSGSRADSFDEEAWKPLMAVLTRLTRRRLRDGVPMQETGSLISAFKAPLLQHLTDDLGDDADALRDELALATRVLDQLSLRVAQVYLGHRETIIERQRKELIELSTPVVKIWDGIIALPLIGTLDSSRTQVVMERMLDAIVAHEALVAILDITGVPTVDTEVAHNLMKTVSAARLMGADCVISGIRPAIAQTIVQLGIRLEDIQSRASFSDAIAFAFRRTGRQVVPMGG